MGPSFSALMRSFLADLMGVYEHKNKPLHTHLPHTELSVSPGQQGPTYAHQPRQEHGPMVLPIWTRIAIAGCLILSATVLGVGQQQCLQLGTQMEGDFTAVQGPGDPSKTKSTPRPQWSSETTALQTSLPDRGALDMM